MSKKYESPFSSRYTSAEMQEIFSSDRKFKTWRKLWIALARAESELGLPVSKEQVSELESYADELNLEVAEAREKECRHDVMSHVYAYGVQCPKAKAIIHLGATSCYVCDNTEIILMRDALKLVRNKVLCVIRSLADFAERYKSLPTLGYTHLQPAQLTTVGKRATLWINDLVLDIEELDFRIASLKLLGNKGTTGTQASFLELFNGDYKKVCSLEQKIATEMGFDEVYPVSGQTYSRTVDSAVCNTLMLIAEGACKFSNDMRLMQNFKEMEEPFEKSQIGSSAMPYKRNPMRCERMGSLARYVISNAQNPALTAATQWFERTLDDSANKRISVAEAFLGIDAVLNIYMNVADGLVVYPKMIYARLMDELPFMASENIMMDAVKKGGDRQELHEKIRVYAQEAGMAVKRDGLKNDLIERIAADESFGLTKDDILDILKPEKYIGCAEVQTENYLKEVVRPLLSKFANEPQLHSQLTI